MKFNDYITEVSKKQLEEFGVIKSIEQNCQPFIKEFRNTGLSDIIWRGTYRGINKSITEITPRKDRIPVDMPEELHYELDKLFKVKFGWPARSEGVFVISNKSTAMAYGTDIAIFIPVGKYKYLYNPDIKDLFSEVGEDADIDVDSHIDEWSEEWSYEYGPGEQGTWYYMDADTGENEEGAARAAAAEAEGVDEDEIDFSEMKWVPDMAEADFIQEKKDGWEETYYTDLEALVDRYQDKNLKKAVTSQVEIMFKCKTYYIIDKRFKKVVLQYLKTGKEPYDLKQMQFAFEKDPKMRRALPGMISFKHKGNPLWSYHDPTIKLKQKLHQKLKDKKGKVWTGIGIKGSQQSLPSKQG